MIHNIQIVPAIAPEWGGPARSVPNLSLELAKLGIRVTLLFADIGERYQPPELPAHRNLTCVSLPAKIVIGLKPAWITGFKRTLKELCHTSDQVIIHDHGIWLPHNGVVARVSRELGVPLIVAPRGMLEPRALQYRKWRKLIAWNLWQDKWISRADLIHATSRGEADHLLKKNLGKPIVILSNGTQLPDLRRKQDIIPNRKRRLLFLSRIHPEKGLINLVNAFKSIHPTDWELIIAGYDELNHQKEVQKEVDTAGLSNSVRFLGPVGNEEKWQVYRDSDVFILPSFSESFGIVVVEALASGLPVITTTRTPWTEIPEYDCGWFVDPGEQEIARAMQEAVDMTDQQRYEMGLRGRNLVKQNYTWSAIARRTKDVYSRILNGEISGKQEVIDI
jgi:glycosyltransferase involved in cell wall biosynthesis